MIDVPKYIRIGGHVIRIKKAPNLITTHEAFGTWSEGDLEILIDASLTPGLTWEVFWHEIMEALNSVTDANLNHSFIQTSGLLLHQIFV